MTVSECLGHLLAGKPPDQNVPAELLNPPTLTNTASRLAANATFANRYRLGWGQQFDRSLDEAPFWPAFGKMLARNLILLAIGCCLVAGVYTIAARKPTAHPQVIMPATATATPTPEAAAVMLASPEPASTIEVETPAPTIQAEAPAGTVEAETSETAPAASPAPTVATATPFQHEPVMRDKPPRDKHSTHNAAHRSER
jgi:hypothetical protein